jgi:hypothetical protein
MDVLIFSVAVAMLAVARITRFLVEDRLTVSWRQWVIRRFGAESLPSYLVHCPWCMSFWVGLALMMWPALYPYPWVIGLYAIPASSMIAGLLVDREK